MCSWTADRTWPSCTIFRCLIIIIIAVEQNVIMSRIFWKRRRITIICRRWDGRVFAGTGARCTLKGRLLFMSFYNRRDQSSLGVWRSEIYLSTDNHKKEKTPSQTCLYCGGLGAAEERVVTMASDYYFFHACVQHTFGTVRVLFSHRWHYNKWSLTENWM